MLNHDELVRCIVHTATDADGWLQPPRLHTKV